MAKKQKKKHVPQRTCVGCRTVQAKRSLIRIVRTKSGVQIDTTGKQPGRGAYLHNTRSCWESGLQGPLARALKTEIKPGDMGELSNFMNSLPKEERPPQE